MLDWIRCLPSLQLGRNVADDAWSRAAVDSLMADFPRPLRPVPSKIQALVDQSARLLEHPDPAQDDSEGSEVSHMPFDTTESAALQEVLAFLTSSALRESRARWHLRACVPIMCMSGLPIPRQMLMSRSQVVIPIMMTHGHSQSSAEWTCMCLLGSLSMGANMCQYTEVP